MKLLQFFPLGASREVSMHECAVCQSVQGVSLVKYQDAGYNGECIGCDQHVGMPIQGNSPGEACAAWNLFQMKMRRLMGSLPHGISTCS